MLFPALRVILLIAAIGLVVFLLHSIKKSKMSIEDALFWMGFSFLILLMSIFPEIPSFLSDTIGFMSPVTPEALRCSRSDLPISLPNRAIAWSW